MPELKNNSTINTFSTIKDIGFCDGVTNSGRGHIEGHSRQESFFRATHQQSTEPQDHHLPIAGEIALFKAVIMQALLDCVNQSRRTEDRVAKIQASRWFDKNNIDFILTCQFAQLNHKWVLQQSLAAISNGCKRVNKRSMQKSKNARHQKTKH